MGYKAKHAGKYTGLNRKYVVLAISLLLIVCCTAGGTLAFLIMETPPVENTFLPTNTSISVDEKLENGVKKDVKIVNNGNIPAYIRATVVVTWQNDAGEVLGVKPVSGTDYNMILDGTGWDTNTSDSFYYYKTPVAANSSTGVLIDECKQLQAAPQEGYKLHVEILAQSIQSEPIDAVQEAWSVTVTNGLISK